MKKPLMTLLLSLAATTALPAATTITVSNFTPNGSPSGGSAGNNGILSSSAGTAASDVSLPTTTYTVTGVDLTSEGGTANESFAFTVSYSQTGGTGVQFNGFGNVSVTGGDNNQVGTTETLTATISLSSSSFAGLSLSGFTTVRAGGVGSPGGVDDEGTFTHDGGVANITPAAREASISGNTVTMAVSTGAFNFEGFRADFVAVPEPASLSMLGLGALTLLRRRRSA